MDDATPDNLPTGAGSTDAGKLAADALKAAQAAVSSLKTESSSPTAGAAGGDDAAAQALRAAQAAIAQAREMNADAPLGSVTASSSAGPAAGMGNAAVAGAAPFQLPKITPASAQQRPEGIDLLADVNLNVRIELGRTRMLVEDVLRLGEGSVVELDKLAGDPVDVYVNERHVARGEVLVLNDNFCVRVNEIVEQVGDRR
jgi:flagellar motor switch protein FliN/FliY